MLSGWVNVLWLLYPIAFSLSDGANRIGTTSGLVFFSVLDVLMIPVLSFAFVFLGCQWNFAKLNLAISHARRGSTQQVSS
jgi:bacteriorhodopsin